ncbi:MAG: septum formation initiator family protein [Bacteroidales bacterium]|nr:septum formation initiator family protein [Bacteroidales bacterium]MCF8333924.1 septum formation initiator family protein [Bacteroidales bacterium]
MMRKYLNGKRLFFIITLVFAVWMLFIDDFNVFHRLSLNKKINSLEEQKEYYRKEIKRDSALIKTLKNNPDSMERYAREKYLMKKKDEDIFLIIDESED